jgi:putative restriction endonuclease
MANGVFMHRDDSIYKDIPSKQYQFPKSYYSRAKEFEGDWIVYLEPSSVKKTKGYFAIAKVQEIIPDPDNEIMFIAIIEPGSYVDFGRHVPFRENNQIIESGLLNDVGKMSGRAQAAVRPISVTDFEAIISKGLENEILPREAVEDEHAFDENIQPLNSRPRVEQLTSRIARDSNFRKIVLNAYDESCAITGIRLINGGGRAEAQAAHIRPVEHNGPDIVSNGIALSGTVHWMFDRGLISLSNDFKILISRQTNDPDVIKSMINSTGFIIPPERPSDCPKPEFIEWHRENCFKS